ncbi:hypothetical protein J3458_001827 [Metarhizium acridum]|uniref:uncharacterized protein n=1 Tax=Metarhizium acridum TaxID=92637 RepID=UPI001C6C9966|nr:hypothetical protein J3458_001827 [Metarhizium acridum]
MPVNHVVLASGAVVAVSVAVAAAMAMYENPELRRYADDIRRRIAVALHSLGDGINPPEQAPRFNRPEDAEGFLQSSRGAGAEPGVDADEATRRRQREELLYWNSVLLRKKEEESAAQPPPAALPPAESSSPRTGTRGSSFDDFLRQDENAEQGTYVFNTGADIRDANSGLRHRVHAAAPMAAPPVAAASLYANPFADEHCIANDEVEDLSATHTLPQRQEHMSDIYSATTRENDDVQSRTLDGPPALIELSSPNFEAPPPPPATLERELAENEYMSAGQDDREDAYASIQAWAHDSSRNFYSPLPVTPVAPVSEPEVVSDGQLTPTDSVSVIVSGGDVGSDNDSRLGRPFDVMSESEGMLTPASWSEVGSVVSETEGHGHVDVNIPLHG